MRPVRSNPVQFKVEFATCPVQASLGVLGRRWSFLVLRDIALFRATRFNEMLRATPGITKRVLAMRLHELEREGFIARAEVGRNYTRWAVTEKGRDVLPVLMTLVRFGSKWHAGEVFADGRSRRLDEIFDERYIRRVLELPRRSRRRAAAPSSAPATRLPSAASPVGVPA
ncbi:MAG: winged helix-turn-helix transcriptional regulator [Thermoplasmata archaeon]